MKSLPYIFALFFLVASTQLQAQAPAATPTRVPSFELASGGFALHPNTKIGKCGVDDHVELDGVSNRFNPCKTCPNSLKEADGSCKPCKSGCNRWYISCKSVTLKDKRNGKNFTIKDYGASFCPQLVKENDSDPGVCKLKHRIEDSNSYSVEDLNAGTFKTDACTNILLGEIIGKDILFEDQYLDGRLFDPVVEIGSPPNNTCVNVHYFEPSRLPEVTPTATPVATATGTSVPSSSGSAVLGGT